MTKTVEGIRFAGDILMVLGAWFHHLSLITVGVAVIVIAWCSEWFRKSHATEHRVRVLNITVHCSRSIQIVLWLAVHPFRSVRRKALQDEFADQIRHCITASIRQTIQEN